MVIHSIIDHINSKIYTLVLYNSSVDYYDSHNNVIHWSLLVGHVMCVLLVDIICCCRMRGLN